MTIDYGIYLGTSSASIAKMEAGESIVLKSDTQKESIPLCVAFTKKRSIIVGDAALNAYKLDILTNSIYKKPINSFTEFIRTIGTDKLYYSSNTDRSYSSEELLAEVFKHLLLFEKSKDIRAAVITIPSSYKQNQIDAVRRAGKMAGLKQIEFIQEPIAAAMTYNLDSKKKDGFWLVFDYGEKTFNSTLLKVEDGIMKVTDTEGDNYLGGKNLDLAIVDELIIPYLSKNYNIEETLGNDAEKQVLRSAMKFYAEEAKNILSLKERHNIYVDPGDAGADNDGEEIEIDITLTQRDMETVLSPVFQRAIDKCKTLLERNNLKGSDLDSLILVGGPTFSPVLRKMLEQQICKPDTSVDPLTAIVKGATLYASTISVSKGVKEHTRDKPKIQIEIGYEASSVETEEWVTIKILKDKTEGTIPNQVFAEVTRSDKAWSSGKIEINELGELIETHLVKDKTNNFTVTLSDGEGNLLESEPNEFTIIQGIEGLNEMQGLTLNLGIEKQDKRTGKVIFCTIPGLEKNKSLPAEGTMNGIKTEKPMYPGDDSYSIKIPLYQGEHGADGTRAIYNEHVFDIIISGADLPALLPENSDVDLTIHIDKSQKVSIQAYFPYLDHTAEIEVPSVVSTVKTDWLANEIRKAKGSIQELQRDGSNSEALNKVKSEIDALETQFKNNQNDVDNKQEVLINLRQTLKTIDTLEEQTEWPKLEEKLKNQFYKLEDINKELGDKNSTRIVNQLRSQLEEVIRSKDVKIGNALFEEINSIKVPSQISYDLVEDLLFKFTEEDLIDATNFQTYFDQLYKMKDYPQQEALIRIYKELKQYEK